MLKRIKILCVTGSRADYPRVKSVLKEIRNDKKFNLKIIVTGSHLLKEYGYSIKEIYKDKFKVHKKIKIFNKNFNTLYGMTIAAAKCTLQLAKELNKLKPNIVLLTVDRIETLGAAVAVSLMNLPIAHIQGGEVTGTIDENIRHAVSKLSHFHFVSNEDARLRLIRMGERKDRVFNVGCPYINIIKNNKYISKSQLSNKYGFNSKKKLAILIQHAVVNEFGHSKKQIKKTLEAIKKFSDLQIISIYSNTDAGSKEIIQEIKKNKFIKLVKNINSNEFLSLLKISNFIIGNSSSGIREASSFKIPVINIGTRQNKRLRAKNVIDVSYDVKEIEEAIKKCLFDKTFKKKIKKIKNPYGNEGAPKKIKNILKKINYNENITAKVITY
jgi:UDP-N-acetylglucosamine 2-epimerase (non-hydrolysing)/GDP/UDP-N,N'-diacetylbacillosamine 2-epimerase (hydrolysing)